MVMYGLNEGLPGFTGNAIGYGAYGSPGMYGGSQGGSAWQGGMQGMDMNDFVGMLMQAMRMYQQKGMQLRGSEQQGMQSQPFSGMPQPTQAQPASSMSGGMNSEKFSGSVPSAGRTTATGGTAQPLPEAGGSPLYWRMNKGWM